MPQPNQVERKKFLSYFQHLHKLITYNTNKDVENINIVSIEKFIFCKR
jgi:hypothetical protein